MTRLAAGKNKRPTVLTNCGPFYCGETRQGITECSPHEPGDPKACRYSLTFSGETERMTKPLSRLDRNRFRSL